jgi:hypothetical protein
MGSEGAAPPPKLRATRRPHVLPPAVVFGTVDRQDLVLRMHREGPIDVRGSDTFWNLIKAGLAVRSRAEVGWKLALDPRHPLATRCATYSPR